MNASFPGLTGLLVVLVSSSAQAQERLPASQAFEQMAEGACRQVHGDDRAAIAACLAHHFDPSAPEDRALAEMGDDEGDVDDRACMEAGGVLREAMPACTQALARMFATDSNSAVPLKERFASLMDVIVLCSSKLLCNLPDDLPE